jgi:hypothetical protein
MRRVLTMHLIRENPRKMKMNFFLTDFYVNILSFIFITPRRKPPWGRPKEVLLGGAPKEVLLGDASNEVLSGQ